MPVPRLTAVMDSTVAEPLTDTTSVSVMTSIRGERLRRSTRYWDIVDFRLGPRTITRTLRALSARYAAAWPAEFPPPTTTTSSPRHRSASMPIAA